jgi:hypothetical protein
VNPVRDLEHVRHVVADQDDAQALLAQISDQPEHLTGLPDAERGRRLVQDHHLPAEGGRPSHGDRLLLSAGKRLDRLVDVLQGADAQVVDVVLGLPLHPAGVEHPQD